MDEELEPTETIDRSRNIGRRLFLSIVGIAGVSVAFGTKLQNRESRVLAWISKRGSPPLSPARASFVFIRLLNHSLTSPMTGIDSRSMDW